MERHSLPNATAVLILGILSILTCCCYGIGVILAIIALILASKDMKIYKENPEIYTNYANLNIGRILSIIGLVLSALSLLFTIYFSVIMSEEESKEFLENLQVKLEQQQQEQENQE